VYLTLSCILLFALVNTYVEKYGCVNLVQVYLFHFGWEGNINGNLIFLV